MAARYRIGVPAVCAPRRSNSPLGPNPAPSLCAVRHKRRCARRHSSCPRLTIRRGLTRVVDSLESPPAPAHAADRRPTAW
jgi:hypothetical protein